MENDGVRTTADSIAEGRMISSLGKNKKRLSQYFVDKLKKRKKKTNKK